MSQLSTGLGRQEKQAAIAVPPREASRLLSLSLSKIYQLLRAGELDSYSDGKARRVIVASIYAYIERRLAAGAGAGVRGSTPGRLAVASKRRRRVDKTQRPSTGDAGPKLERLSGLELRPSSKIAELIKPTAGGAS